MRLDNPVILTQEQMDEGESRGDLMLSESLRRGCKDRHGAAQASPEEKREFVVLGQRGELAFGLYHGVTWPKHINVGKKVPDFPPHWQIRTRSKDTYDLVIRPDDALDQRFVLMTARGNAFTYRGWIFARDATIPMYWKKPNDRPYAWFIPQDHLHKTLVPEEKQEEWLYYYDERIGILTQRERAKPTLEERMMAEQDANYFYGL